MSRTPIRSSMAPPPPGPASAVISAGHYVFVSAQLPRGVHGETGAVDVALETWFTPLYPALTLTGVPWLPGDARLQVAAIAQRY